MQENRRVLLLSEAVGAGHNKAAEAIDKALHLLDPQVQTLRIDTFKYVNRLLNKLIVETYLEILRFTPQVYGFLYARAASAENTGVVADFKKVISTLIATRLKKLISNFKPDVIVCTHPFPCGIMSVFKQREKVSIPIYGVITDFTIHPFWIYDNIDYYMVAAEKLRNDLIVKGIESERIIAAGIPIDPSFSQKFNKQLLRNEFQIADDALVLLIMGGGLGIGPFEEIIDSLRELKGKFHLLIVTGRNQQLKEKLEKAKKNINIPLELFGYTDRIPQLMEVANLLITKPGGLTSAEALAKGLPILIFGSIPGQEVKNTEFLLHSEAAMLVDTPESLIRVIHYLSQNPGKLEQMGEAAREKGHPDAAFQIARHIINSIMN